MDGMAFCRIACAASRAAGLIGHDGITDVVAAHFDDVQRVRRNAATMIGEERLHLVREIEVAPVVVGARGADGIVGGVQTVGSERRPNAARQAKRAGELLDPRGAVAEMVTAARVRGARNEQRIQQVIRRRVRASAERERIPGVGQARAEHDNR